MEALGEKETGVKSVEISVISPAIPEIFTVSLQNTGVAAWRQQEHISKAVRKSWWLLELKDTKNL